MEYIFYMIFQSVVFALESLSQKEYISMITGSMNAFFNRKFFILKDAILLFSCILTLLQIPILLSI